MKTRLILLLFVVVSIFSCSKAKVNTVTHTVDTTVTTIDTPFETPLKSLLIKSTIIDTAIDEGTGAGDYELGNQFYTSKNGQISKLGCICATKNVPYEVSLWDVTTTNIIATVSITATDSLHFFYANIAPVNITANTEYMVSVHNTADFYLLFNASESNLAYPFSDGSITFTASNYSYSLTTIYPSSNYNGYMAPADFVFKAD
jgi:Domain of unknown function (DUF4082)